MAVVDGLGDRRAQGAGIEDGRVGKERKWLGHEQKVREVGEMLTEVNDGKASASCIASVGTRTSFASGSNAAKNDRVAALEAQIAQQNDEMSRQV